jgi:hypothetical protein
MSWRTNNRPEIPQRTSHQQSNRWIQENSRPTYDDVADEDIQDRTRQVQNESLESSRRALSKIHQAEKLGQSNLAKIASQSDQLGRIENKLDSAGTKVKLSGTVYCLTLDAKADQLKSLNRFFLLPSFGGKKVQKREEQVRKEQAKIEAEQEERMKRDQQRQQGIRNVANHSNFTHSYGSKSYTTPEGIVRDDVEEELDSNLDHISKGLSRIKMMSQTMNSELAAQGSQIDRIYEKTATVDERVKNTTSKINSLLKK